MTAYGPHPNARRRGTPWTPEDDYKLWRLLEARTSHREIAVALGRTTIRINWRAKILRRQLQQDAA